MFVRSISVCILLFTNALVFAQGWGDVPSILARIIVPVFPDKDYDVTQFGATGNGTSDCTSAFTNAIDSCSRNGGGRVVVPAGNYLTGAIHLKSNVNLYISKGATILFSTDLNKYLPVVLTRFESVECMNYSPLVYALDQENIAVTGEGTLDGQGDVSWWGLQSKQGTDRTNLFGMGENNTPVANRVFGSNHYLRPNFFQPYRCKNILVQGVTFKDSPMWFLNPVLCQNISIVNVTVEGLGPNNDGCDPECSKDVLIKNCTFNNGDDCIAIKSGRNGDGRRANVASENIIITDCKMKDGHGGITIGSETSGSVRNVYAEKDTLSSANLNYALRFKTNSVRGGTIENIYYRDIIANEVAKDAIIIDFNYEEGDAGTFTPVVKNINIENFTCNKASDAMYLNGYQRSPISDITLKNCTFTNMSSASYYSVNVSNLKLENVKINGKDVSTVKTSHSDASNLKSSVNLHFNKNEHLFLVNFSLDNRTLINLSIHDLSGRTIFTTDDIEYPRGAHVLKYDYKTLKNGMYLCCIKPASQIRTLVPFTVTNN